MLQTRVESIACPFCHSIQVATVHETEARTQRAHRCTLCNNVIWEYDWHPLPWWGLWKGST